MEERTLWEDLSCVSISAFFSGFLTFLLMLIELRVFLTFLFAYLDFRGFSSAPAFIPHTSPTRQLYVWPHHYLLVFFGPLGVFEVLAIDCCLHASKLRLLRVRTVTLACYEIRACIEYYPDDNLSCFCSSPWPV
jgi:hypothetical protein